MINHIEKALKIISDLNFTNKATEKRLNNLCHIIFNEVVGDSEYLYPTNYATSMDEIMRFKPDGWAVDLHESSVGESYCQMHKIGITDGCAIGSIGREVFSTSGIHAPTLTLAYLHQLLEVLKYIKDQNK